MYHHAYAATRAWRCSSATPSLPNTLHTVLKSVTSSQVLLVGSRAWCSTAAEPPPHRVAIIGSGPAGFYTAKYLLRGADHVHVDVYDRLPTPFGLVRYGVAPDHPEVKSVINDFREVATSDKFGFVGGLAVGTEQPHGGPCVTVEELSQHYAAVVFAVGAQGEKSLGVPGGDSLANVLSARQFVNWYNGHPDFASLAPPLEKIRHVVVIGNGNVAIDCARVLAKSAAELHPTDIAPHALAALQHSAVESITVLGRRGHCQAAFTMKELRELTKLDNASFLVYSEELEAGTTPASASEIKSTRVVKRLDGLLKKSALPKAQGIADASASGKPRTVTLRFLRSPKEYIASDSDGGSVGAVRVGVNKLVGDAGSQRAVADESAADEVLPADLVLESIGYKSLPLAGVPFDDSNAVLRNEGGVIVDGDGKQVKGMYCTGWCKRGPSGIIGTNIPDAREAAAAVLQDIESGALEASSAALGAEGVRAIVEERHGVEALSRLVDWAGAERIAAAEAASGASDSQGERVANKVVDVDEMLAVANTQ